MLLFKQKKSLIQNYKAKVSIRKRFEPGYREIDPRPGFWAYFRTRINVNNHYKNIKHI